MKKLIKIIAVLGVVITMSACTTDNDCQYKNKQYNNETTCPYCGQQNCNHKMHHKNKANKKFSKMYTRNNHGEASEIGYVKFYDAGQNVKMVVNVDKLRNGVDYTTKIYQCSDPKCTNPDTCCMETTMSLEMPLTRKNKNSPMLQETFIIENVNTNQLEGATIFFERDNGYRAAWGFID